MIYKKINKSIPDLNCIKEDLKMLHRYSLIIFGSILGEYFTPNRSDIDVAIISFSKNKQENLRLWRTVLCKIHPRYDIRIFELFPLYIQINIINNYQVLFGDSLEISEYFYFYRTLWADMEHRVQDNQFKNSQEFKGCIQKRKEVNHRNSIKPI